MKYGVNRMRDTAPSLRNADLQPPSFRMLDSAWIVAVLMMLAVLSQPGMAQEQIYTWTDDQGVVHFSNSGAPRGTTATPLFSPNQFRPVPLEVDASNPSRKFVRVELQGTNQKSEVRMIVDTGAERTVITPAVASTIGVNYKRDQLLRGVTGAAVGSLVELPWLRIGSMELRSVDVVVGPSDAPNLLGMDVLDTLNLSVGPDRLYRGR